MKFCLSTRERANVYHSIIGNMSFDKLVSECEKAGPTTYFWYRTTLDISDDIESGNTINWTIAFSLLFAWLVVWLCMIKRIRSEGKVNKFSFLSFYNSNGDKTE